MANISPFFKLIFSAIFVISRFRLFASLSILYFSELPTAPIDSKLSISSFSLLINSNNSFLPATCTLRANISRSSINVFSIFNPFWALKSARRATTLFSSASTISFRNTPRFSEISIKGIRSSSPMSLILRANKLSILVSSSFNDASA